MPVSMHRQLRSVLHTSRLPSRHRHTALVHPRKLSSTPREIRQLNTNRAIAIGDLASQNGVRPQNSERTAASTVWLEGNAAKSSARDCSSEPCMTTFRYPAALAGEKVYLVGSFGFSRWTKPRLMEKTLSGDFVLDIKLPPGTYQYKFIVDGDWRNSLSDVTVADEQGRYNNQVTVYPATEFTYDHAGPQQEVCLAGDFNGWSGLVPMTWDAVSKSHKVKYSLPPGAHRYMFLVDNKWCVTQDAPQARTETGHVCHKMTVAAPPAFTVFYATGWENTFLNIRYLSEDGTPGEWEQILMADAPSRARPSGGRWKVGSLPIPPGYCGSVSPPTAEFYLTDGNGGLDKPGQDVYRLPSPGACRLQKGRITPFRRAQEPPTMLVSDLDGTMVYDNNEGDDHMRRFTEYWENSASLARSVLVYNTGRSLGQFMGLWKSKRGDLALPDALITAVGTKVWRLEDSTGSGRSRLTHEPVWVEDLNWTRRLDEGWDLATVHRIAEKAMQRANNGAHWLDEGTEHPHRVALSVRADLMSDICAELKANFQNAGLKVRLIISGTGEWRYVDCVAFRAGKLEAMEYVRSMYGIPIERCVAAGDSGNDILMMEGSHPSIVVGNAQRELVDFALRQGGERVVFTEAFYACGILEGLARHGLF